MTIDAYQNQPMRINTMKKITVSAVINGFVVAEEDQEDQRFRTWVFPTPQELATFIADHFEPKIKATEAPRKVIHPVTVGVADQDGSYGVVKWDLETKEYPAGAREKIGDVLIGVRPGLYRQEVNVPAQYGSWMPASNPIPDDKPASDLSDITASVIKRQGL